MEWQFIVALVVAIPVILFPVAFVWYLNVGGLYTAVHEARKRKAAQRAETKVMVEEEATEKELVGTRK
jgi:uncharacterized paraquat-inducible protein A